eukprot:gene762-biopygen4670
MPHHMSICWVTIGSPAVKVTACRLCLRHQHHSRLQCRRRLQLRCRIAHKRRRSSGWGLDDPTRGALQRAVEQRRSLARPWGRRATRGQQAQACLARRAGDLGERRESLRLEAVTDHADSFERQAQRKASVPQDVILELPARHDRAPHHPAVVPQGGTRYCTRACAAAPSTAPCVPVAAGTGRAPQRTPALHPQWRPARLHPAEVQPARSAPFGAARPCAPPIGMRRSHTRSERALPVPEGACTGQAPARNHPCRGFAGVRGRSRHLPGGHIHERRRRLRLRERLGLVALQLWLGHAGEERLQLVRIERTAGSVALRRACAGAAGAAAAAGTPSVAATRAAGAGVTCATPAATAAYK